MFRYESCDGTVVIVGFAVAVAVVLDFAGLGFGYGALYQCSLSKYLILVIEARRTSTCFLYLGAKSI